ncbi:MAG: tryptophan synthase subunit alpha [Egibacteraceae bacterium]
MNDVVTALVNRNYPIRVEMWRSFWDQLHSGKPPRGEAVALVSSLSTQMPDETSLSALLTSLEERRKQPKPPTRETVNIVGTGGGPSTFNISTASAFVAATLGARIVKTGSRAYSSPCGSFDLLDRLGVPLTTSYAQTEEMLERFGIACAGSFVYPEELALLAQSIFPLDMRLLGRFFNRIGPFLAAVPVSAQITGVSDLALLPTFRRLAAQESRKRVWICANRTGVDELISFENNFIYRSAGQSDVLLTPGALGLGAGSLKDLSPAAENSSIVDHFMMLLAGDGPRAASQSICLNAAALAMACGVADDWSEALGLATKAIECGRPIHLIEQIREHAERHCAVAPRQRYGLGTSKGSGGRPGRSRTCGAKEVARPDERMSPKGSKPHSLQRTHGAADSRTQPHSSELWQPNQGGASEFFTERHGEEPGLALFLNAGDPSFDVLNDLVLLMDSCRVDCLELAVPFPNSPSDGPVIRRSAVRALENGVDLDAVLAFVQSVRPQIAHLKIVLLADWRHTVRALPLREFLTQVQGAGSDALLVHGLPPRLRHDYYEMAHRMGQPIVTTCYASSRMDIMEQAGRHASAYLYLAAYYGRTGTALPPDYRALLPVMNVLREVTDAPIAVGFGVKNRSHIQALSEVGADAAIVGSSCVSCIEQAMANGSDVVEDFHAFLLALKGPKQSMAAQVRKVPESTALTQVHDNAN